MVLSQFAVYQNKLEAMDQQKVKRWEERAERGQGKKEDAMRRRNSGMMEQDGMEEEKAKVDGAATVMLSDDDEFGEVQVSDMGLEPTTTTATAIRD